MTSPDPIGDLLLEVSLVCFVTGYLTLPLITFVHELGHALVAIDALDQRVTIRIGQRDALFRFALGRVDVRWHPTGSLAHCECLSEEMSPRDHVRVALAGPLASLALFVSLAAAAWALHLAEGSSLTFWIVAITAVEALVGVLNLIPFRRSPWGPRDEDDTPFDGWIVREMTKLYRGSPLWNVPRLKHPDRSPPAPEPVLSEPAARLILRADREARDAGCGYVGTEHLLLALAAKEGSVGALLRRAGVDPAKLRGAVQAPDSNALARSQAGRLPVTPRLTRAVDRARGYRSLRGDAQVCPEHLALAVLDDRDGRAAGAVRTLGTDPERLRGELLGTLAQV